MSSGAFVRAKYTGSDSGEYFVQVQPETLTLTIGATANAAPSGAIAPGASRVFVSGSRRQRRKFSRVVRIKFSGAPPTNYKADSVITLPILTPTVFALCTEGAAGTYLGANIVVVGATSGKAGG
jgi:hypothetical protein